MGGDTAHRTLQIERLGDENASGARLWSVGTIEAVLAGRRPPERWIDASAFKAGFEAGSPRGIESIGEFMLIDGTAFAKSTDSSSPDHEWLVAGPRFVTNGALLISRDTQPGWRARCTTEADDLLELGALFPQLLAVADGAPMCFVGPVEFEDYRATFISRAPIDGLPILDHMDAYYTRPPLEATSVPTLVMGCLASHESLRSGVLSDVLQKVLYVNPQDEEYPVAFHVHSMVLDRPLERLDEFSTARARDVHHLLASSRPRFFDLEIYPIESIEPLDA